ncbi:MAG: hypothetical protein PS018_06565 [bacterium]|nr:hypothetical protein [bacterium]
MPIWQYVAMTPGSLASVRTDFEAGLGRAEIRHRHGCTRGQLASWARRFGWRRPPPVVLVKMLTGQQRTAYRRLRRRLPRTEALAHARTAPPQPGRSGRRRRNEPEAPP